MPTTQVSARKEARSRFWRRRRIIFYDQAPVAAVLLIPALIYGALRWFWGYIEQQGMLDLAAIALALIAVFRLADGRFEVDVLGIRLRNGSATWLLWIISFAAFVIAAQS